MPEKPKDIHTINQEQTKAALQEQLAAAAAEVFAIQMLEPDLRSKDDMARIEQHKDRLLSFAPALLQDLGEHFSKDVASVIKQCNEILDQPLKSILPTEDLDN